MDIDRRAVFHTARQRGPGLRLGPLISEYRDVCTGYGGSPQLALQQALDKSGLLTRIQRAVVLILGHISNTPVGLGHVLSAVTCEFAAKALHYAIS